MSFLLCSLYLCLMHAKPVLDMPTCSQFSFQVAGNVLETTSVSEHKSMQLSKGKPTSTSFGLPAQSNQARKSSAALECQRTILGYDVKVVQRLLETIHKHVCDEKECR